MTALDSLFQGLAARRRRIDEEEYRDSLTQDRDQRASDRAEDRETKSRQAALDATEERLLGRPGKLAGAMGLSAGAREYMMSHVAKAGGDYNAALQSFNEFMPKERERLTAGGGKVGAGTDIALGAGGGGGEDRTLEKRLADLDSAAHALGALWDMDQRMTAPQQMTPPGTGTQVSPAQTGPEPPWMQEIRELQAQMQALQGGMVDRGQMQMLRRNSAQKVPLGNPHR